MDNSYADNYQRNCSRRAIGFQPLQLTTLDDLLRQHFNCLVENPDSDSLSLLINRETS